MNWRVMILFVKKHSITAFRSHASHRTICIGFVHGRDFSNKPDQIRIEPHRIGPYTSVLYTDESFRTKNTASDRLHRIGPYTSVLYTDESFRTKNTASGRMHVSHRIASDHMHRFRTRMRVLIACTASDRVMYLGFVHRPIMFVQKNTASGRMHRSVNIQRQFVPFDESFRSTFQ